MVVDRFAKIAVALVFMLMSLLSSKVIADDILLTLTAKDGTAQRLTLADFQRMQPKEIHTNTIWTQGVQRFKGVSLRQVLAQADIHEGTISAVAVNDYMVDIPVADLTDQAPIIAFLHNDQPMSVRDKGPLWVVYPYDSDKSFQTKVVYSRSIWQLNRIDER